MTDNVYRPAEPTPADMPKRKGGRKVSPLTVHIRRFEAAKQKADKARAAAAKVAEVQAALDMAEREEQDATDALQAAIATMGGAL